MRASYLAIVTALGLLSGCAVGPNYKRPELPLATSFRAPGPLPAPQVTSLADLNWFEVFRDQALQELVRVALSQNDDLRDAVTRVEQARANLGITRSNQAPQLDASGSLNFTRLSQGGSVPLPSGFSIKQNLNYGQAESIFCLSRSISGDVFAARPRRRERTC
jgi:multidrug efflux system outer membrane protein